MFDKIYSKQGKKIDVESRGTDVIFGNTITIFLFFAITTYVACKKHVDQVNYENNID